MSGIESITQRIEDEARLEIDKIKSNAEAECARIKSLNKEIAEKEYWKLISKGKENADHRYNCLKSVAQVEVKKQLLALKQELISEAFELAVRKILSMPEAQYTDFLISLAVEASETGREQIILSPGDRSRYGKKVTVAANEALSARGKPASLTLSEQTRGIRGGMILSNGNIDINCSLEMIIAQRKNEWIGEVANILFE